MNNKIKKIKKIKNSCGVSCTLITRPLGARMRYMGNRLLPSVIPSCFIPDPFFLPRIWTSFCVLERLALKRMGCHWA
jgi:hypothetical protein